MAQQSIVRTRPGRRRNPTDPMPILLLIGAAGVGYYLYTQGKIGGPSFKDNDLVKTPGGAAVYAYKTNDKKFHLIPSAERFTQLGFQWNQIKIVEEAVITRIGVGSPL